MQSKVQFWIFAADKTEWGGGDTLKEAFVGGVLLFFSLIWKNWRSLQQLALTKENWLWCLRLVSYLLKRTCDGEQSCRPCREVQTVWKVTPRHQQHSQQPYLLGRGSGTQWAVHEYACSSGMNYNGIISGKQQDRHERCVDLMLL